MDTGENVKRYWAFISYSHADKAWADWLHKSLENYPMPRDLVGKPCPADAPIPKRFVPVFRDREELPTATDLGAVIARALRHARFLVVICSPRSAKSQWVEQEIVHYKRMHGEDRVLCLIVDGEPWAGDGKPGFSADDECFPKAVRHRLGADGELSTIRTEPIAADAREGKDGKENAVIKLMAGLLGVGFDDLRRREQAYQRQRVRRLQITAGMFAVLFVAAIGAAAYAVVQKKAVQRTLSQSDLQLAVQARDADDISRSAAYLARSLESDPGNRGAVMAAYSSLAHHKLHPPVGPVLRHPRAVLAAFGSADGKTIVTSSGDRVYLWSRPDNKLLLEKSVDGSDVLSLAEHPSSGTFAAGTAKGNLQFLSMKDLSMVRPPTATGEYGIAVLGWNPAGTVLAAGISETAGKNHGDCLAQFSSEGKELSRLPLEKVIPEVIAWSKDGTQVAVAGSSPTFCVASGKPEAPEMKELPGKLVVTGISFGEDGYLRAIDIFTGLAKWDTVAGKQVGKTISLSPTSSKISFSPDGSHFIGTRRGPAAYLYEEETGNIPTEPISPAFTASHGIYLDGDHVLLTSESGLAQVRQLRPSVPAAKFAHFRSGYPDISALSPDGEVLAAANSSDSLVRFFDTRSLKEIGHPVRFPTPPHGIGFINDGKNLGALCWDGKFHWVEWRGGMKSGEGPEPLVPVIDTAFLRISELRFQKNGKFVAIPDKAGVKVIDTANGTLSKEIPVEGGAAAVAWSFDGSQLVVATGRQTLVYLKPDGSTPAGRVTAKMNAPVIDLAWSPDGRTVAALSNSDRVDCVDAATGAPVGTGFPTGPSSTSVCWVSNGEWLLTSDMNKVSKLWDPLTGVGVAKLPAGGSTDMPSHVLPGRDEILLSGESGFLLVPVPKAGAPPRWVAPFLESMGGGRLSSGRNDPLMDPDAWLSSDAVPGASDNDPVWSPLRKWLLDISVDRAAYPGCDMKESEAAAALAKDVEEKEITAMRKEMGQLWKSDDNQKMAHAVTLLEDALEKDPDLTQLYRTKAQVGEFLEKPEMIRDAYLGIAAAQDSTLLEILEAKTEASRQMLATTPQDTAAARKLLDEVLAVNPENAKAKEVLGKINAAGK
ncbi:MAG: TIR domain-containing protein [Luteolibacter sp.]